jgi:hypothetical protein
MTFTQYEGLASAIFGAIGTAILYVNSYSFQGFSGGVFGSPEVTEYNNNIKVKNAKRYFWQKVGLVFLGVSFAVQGFSSVWG